MWLRYRAPSDRKKQEREVTVRRKRFAQALAEGKRPIAAALAAGCPTVNAAAQFSYKAKNSPGFVEYFNRLLDEAGLDEKTIAAGLKRCSEATKVVGVAVDKNTGKITDHLTHPDYHVQHQTFRAALELRRRLNQRDEDKNPAAAPVILHLKRE